MYKVDYTDEAFSDIEKLERSEPAYYKKTLKLLDELEVHPTTGTGHPEQLKGFVLSSIFDREYYSLRQPTGTT